MLCYSIENRVTHIIVPCGIYYWAQCIKRAQFENITDCVVNVAHFFFVFFLIIVEEYYVLRIVTFRN